MSAIPVVEMPRRIKLCRAEATSKAHEHHKMPQPKRKLTASDRKKQLEQKRRFRSVFIHGKRVRSPHPSPIEGLAVDEFIARNADPNWLQQSEFWEMLPDVDRTVPGEPMAAMLDGRRPPSPCVPNKTSQRGEV